MFAPVFAGAPGTPDMARFIFLDPAAQDFYRDWEQLAEDVVALLRGEAGRDPYDPNLTDLIGELTTRSERFPSAAFLVCAVLTGAALLTLGPVARRAERLRPSSPVGL